MLRAHLPISDPEMSPSLHHSLPKNPTQEYLQKLGPTRLIWRLWGNFHVIYSTKHQGNPSYNQELAETHTYNYVQCCTGTECCSETKLSPRFINRSHPLYH